MLQKKSQIWPLIKSESRKERQGKIQRRLKFFESKLIGSFRCYQEKVIGREDPGFFKKKIVSFYEIKLQFVFHPYKYLSSISTLGKWSLNDLK